MVLVLEGRARDGVAEGDADGLTVVHAPASGDDELVARSGPGVVVVTADRALSARVRGLGGVVESPLRLLDALDGTGPPVG